MTITHLPHTFPVWKKTPMSGRGMRTLCLSIVRTHAEDALRSKLTCTECQDKVRRIRKEFQEMFRMTNEDRTLRRQILQQLIDACTSALGEGETEYLIYGRFVYLNVPFFTWRSKASWPCTWRWGLSPVIEPGGDYYETQEDAIQSAHTYIDEDHLNEQEH